MKYLIKRNYKNAIYFVKKMKSELVLIVSLVLFAIFAINVSNKILKQNEYRLVYIGER